MTNYATAVYATTDSFEGWVVHVHDVGDPWAWCGLPAACVVAVAVAVIVLLRARRRRRKRPPPLPPSRPGAGLR